MKRKLWKLSFPNIENSKAIFVRFKKDYKTPIIKSKSPPK